MVTFTGERYPVAIVGTVTILNASETTRKEMNAPKYETSKLEEGETTHPLSQIARVDVTGRSESFVI